MPWSVLQARTWAPERVRSPTPVRSPSSTIYTGVVAGQAYDQNSTNVPGAAENNDAFGKVMDSRRAGSTTHVRVVESPPKTSEVRPTPAAFSSSPPLEPP